MYPIPLIVARLCLMFAMAGALSSCVTFSNSLVESPIPVDARLVGYWQVISKPGKGNLLIEAGDASTVTAFAIEDAACMKVERFSATRTEIAGHDFLDASTVEQDGKLVELGPVGYEFRDSSHLSLFLPDSKSFEQALTAGELSGETTSRHSLFGGQLKQPTEYPFVIIHSSTADLRRWISLHPAAMRVAFLEFERAEPSQAPQCANDRK